MMNLGSLYANGWGVMRNMPTACRYYKQAADASGEAQAEGNVGVCWLNGDFNGVVDRAGAARWLRKAAAKGLLNDRARTSLP